MLFQNTPSIGRGVFVDVAAFAVHLLLNQLVTRRFGVGRAHFVGQLVWRLEERPRLNRTVEDVCRLVGNAGYPIRIYHSNEFIHKEGGSRCYRLPPQSIKKIQWSFFTII